MQPISYPPFDFAHLINVQPLLATERVGDFALTLDSIEHYAQGFLLVLWVAAEVGPLHLFSILARDDSGREYAGRMVMGHGGGGGEQGWNNRVVYSFMPELDPAARSLRLTMTHARRLRIPGPGEALVHSEDILGGPWEFAFALGKRSKLELPKGKPQAPDEPRSAASVPFHYSSWPPQMAQNVAHGPGDAGTPPPRFDGSQLRRVIPVAQQQEVERFALTLLSMESYTDGFFAVMRTDYPEPDMHLPHPFHWQATDDLGNRYWPRGVAGSGGGHLNQTTSWRIDCPFIPALAPEAHQLRIWLDEAEFSNGPFGLSRPAKTVAIAGRWELAVDV